MSQERHFRQKLQVRCVKGVGKLDVKIVEEDKKNCSYISILWISLLYRCLM